MGAFDSEIDNAQDRLQYRSKLGILSRSSPANLWDFPCLVQSSVAAGISNASYWPMMIPVWR
jgi:hypothetical protein